MGVQMDEGTRHMHKQPSEQRLGAAMARDLWLSPSIPRYTRPPAPLQRVLQNARTLVHGGIPQKPKKSDIPYMFALIDHQTHMHTGS